MEKLKNIGGYNTTYEFVDSKLKRLKESDMDFSSFFELMFTERENIIYERSEGPRIYKTTYGECYEDIMGLSSSLDEMLGDIPKDSVIGLDMANSLLWIEMFWSILRCGYKVLLINSLLDSESIERLLKDAECRAIISDGKKRSIRTVIASEVEKKEKRNLSNSFGSEIMVMSSGTSLHPKVCAYSAKEFYAVIEYSGEIIKESSLMQKHYHGELKQLTFLPFYHIFGLVAVYIWFTFFSRTFVELKDFAPETILKTIRRHEVTHIFAVPLFWEKVYSEAIKTIRKRGEDTFYKFNRALNLSVKLDSRLFKKYAFKEVRDNLFGDSICFMISGGSFIKEEVLQFFNGIGYHLSNGYGSSEIGITSVELSEKSRHLNSGSIGKPMRSIEYRINEDGELLVRGNSVSKYTIEDGVRKENDGWFNTHDLAIEKSGRYYLLGRKDDLVIGDSGENLNPNIIEPELMVEGLKHICLLNDKGTPMLVCFVDQKITGNKLEKIDVSLKEKIKVSNFGKEIKKIVYTSDAFMNDGDIKVNRARILKSYQNGNMTLLEKDRIDDNKIRTDLYNRVREIYLKSLDREDVSDDGDFFIDNGGTSLDYFALISDIEEEFGVTLPLEEDRRLSSLKEVYEYIRKIYD